MHRHVTPAPRARLPALTHRRFAVRTSVAVVALFLSGFAALVYQLCWVREAALIFGATVYAVSTVLAVFFAGLAAGAALAARVARRHTRPLHLFAVLEITLGMVALLVPHGFDLARAVLAWGYPWLAQHPALLLLGRFVLLGAILLVPALIMGASLPLFVRQYTAHGTAVARPVGLLYAVNTLGAAAGCAATGLVLIPLLGVDAAVQLGAGVNIATGIALGCLRVPAVPAPASAAAPAPGSGAALVGGTMFVAGAVAIGNEVLWTRFLALLVPNSVITYTVTIGVVLLGIVAGSLLAAWLGDRSAHPLRALAALLAAQALAVMAVMHLEPATWRLLGEGLPVYLVLLLAPAALAGAALPLAVRIVAGDMQSVSGHTGRLYAVNTVGGIAGSIVVGFVLLPRYGLAASLWLTTGASLAAGAALWLAGAGGTRRWRLGTVGAAAALWLAIPALSDTRLPGDFLAGRDALVAVREGVGSNLAVIRDRGVLQLEIDRWWQGSDEKNHQVVAAHLPMLLHRAPRRVLVVGAGTGQTPSRFLMYDVARVDCVDIEPAVFDVIREHFDARWMDDARVRLVSDDGRNFIANTRARYDVISLEVGQIFRPGVASLYTAEFYRDARRRLAPGGLLAQFVPLPFFTPAEFRTVLSTFLAEFPASVLWFNTAELLLVGWNADHPDVDAGRLRALGDLPAVRADLDFSYWGGEDQSLARPGVLLAGFLAGPRGLAALARGGATLRDDRPVLEYTSGAADALRASEIPIVGALRAHVEPVGEVLGIELSATERRGIDALRERNLADIVAAARIRQAAPLQRGGAFPQVRERLRQALLANPDNRVARRMLGDVMVPLGDLPAAVAHYRRALAASPDDGLANRGLAYALHRLGRLDEAVERYRRALARWETDADSHNNLGVALAQRGEAGAARRHFLRALELRPDYADARRNLARLAGAAG